MTTTKVTLPMSEAISTLRKEVETNKAANAFFHVCALRSRTRGMLTLEGTAARMEKQGFSFSKEEYEKILKLLANLGFGQLITGGKGEVKAVKDIKITLQSLGQAVCQGEKVKGFTKRNVYQDLPAPAKASEPVKAAEPKPAAPTISPVSINLSVNGKMVTVQLPPNATPADIQAVLSLLKT